ncbi:MAG: ThiF family adenylyltransferase [Bacteroidota bacterium]
MPIHRYSRQLALEEIGEKGQVKLAEASVLVVGCGGLGSALLPFLASSGVGHIGIVDGDKIELSNLHRQVLYSDADIGLLKVDVAAKRLKNQNPEIEIAKYPEFLDAHLALELFPKYDVIVDASDRLKLRYLMSDAAVLAEKPFVHAGIEKWEGQVSVFNYKKGPTYRDIYPEMDKNAPNCSEAGVLATNVGIIGLIQAQEVIKIILDLPDILSGKLLCFNTKNYNQRILTFNKSKSPEITRNSFLNAFGNPSFSSITFDSVIGTNSAIIDVREEGELPIVEHSDITQIPLSDLEKRLQSSHTSKRIVLFCQSGIRSQRAAILFRDAGFKEVYLLKEQAPELSRLIPESI